MADWVLDIKPHSVRISSDPSPSTGWTTVTRVQAEAIQAIPRQYREGTAPAITEMDQAAKDVVDAAAQAASDDSEMAELRSYVYALKKQVRRELNTLRAEAGLPNLTPGGFTSSIRARLEEL